VVLALALLGAAVFSGRGVSAAADDDEDDTAPLAGESAPKVDNGLKGGAGTDADAVNREAQAIKLDGLSVAETQALKDKSEKHQFQAEVNRMMKLIINSLYRNKEIFLRELISNASDALDKIRFLSIRDKNVLGDQADLNIKIHVDKENKVLHITDSGIGMTKKDLITHLGTIAKSGTSEFLAKAQESGEAGADTSNLIGQFGVGFYSAFLVADTVVVTTKNNDDKQYIWTSNAAEYTIVEDPREDEQLKRGTRISLYLKEEAQDYLDNETIRGLVKKYSEFINWDIYLYTSKTVETEEEEDDEEADADTAAADATKEGEEKKDETDGETEVEEEKPKEKKKVSKTVWDWEVINANKPIWTRNSKDVDDAAYQNFYKAFSKDTKDALTHIHFTAEGEVTFRSILYVPSEAPAGFFSDYGKKTANIKMYVRRVFITDEFEDMMPKYLSFITGVVDSDDLPLNVSRETLQQHKLLKVIKKKLVRKALEMLKKLEDEDYKKFWKEYGTAIKLGLIEDYANRSRLAKMLRFASSNSKEELTSLEGYLERMKKDQNTIYFLAGSSRAEVESSPFLERLLKRGFEVLYLTEPVDEYTIQNLPEFEGKKFQNAAKDGLKFHDETMEETKHFLEMEHTFGPLTKWLSEALKEDVEKTVISTRLSESPCALVANAFGWSGNMERIMRSQAYARQDDSSSSFYSNQKKTLEINPRHPLIKELKNRVQALEGKADDSEEVKSAKDVAGVLLDMARLRSGFSLKDSVSFAARVERMLRVSVGVDPNAKVDEEPAYVPSTPRDEEDDEDDEEEAEAESEEAEEGAAKDEL